MARSLARWLDQADFLNGVRWSFATEGSTPQPLSRPSTGSTVLTSRPKRHQALITRCTLRTIVVVPVAAKISSSLGGIFARTPVNWLTSSTKTLEML